MDVLRVMDGVQLPGPVFQQFEKDVLDHSRDIESYQHLMRYVRLPQEILDMIDGFVVQEMGEEFLRLSKIECPRSPILGFNYLRVIPGKDWRFATYMLGPWPPLGKFLDFICAYNLSDTAFGLLRSEHADLGSVLHIKRIIHDENADYVPWRYMCRRCRDDKLAINMYNTYYHCSCGEFMKHGMFEGDWSPMDTDDYIRRLG